MNKKRAVLVYSAADTVGEGRNIGDYIQGLAANQFMKAEVTVDREHLNNYAGEPVRLVMNGWFMQHPENFPPSPAIEPLFVSFHIRPAIADRMLTEKTVDYLRRHGPIGCRDEQTRQILEAHGVPAYYSSCLTLTLGRTYRRPDGRHRHGVCFVDPFLPFSKRDFRKGWPYLLRHPLLALAIYRRLRVQMLAGKGLGFRLRRFFRIGTFMRAYLSVFSEKLLATADYLTPIMSMKQADTDEKKFALADQLVSRYASAKFCVTSRIHCALPCVGIGTPVIFVDAADKDLAAGRFAGLERFFCMLRARPDGLKPEGEIAQRLDLSGKIDEDSAIPCGAEHVPYVQALTAICEKFAQ